MRRLRFAVVILVGSGLALASACGGDEGGTAGAGGSGASGGSSGSGGSAADASLDVNTGGCGPTQPCASGVCVNGICCASADLGCGDVCCNAGEVCLFEQCIVPGKACQGPADCAPGEYCETALGDDADGGSSDAGTSDGGKVCTAPVPQSGKCVPLPPICPEGDAGVPDAGNCVEKCEYFPPPGPLTPVQKWQWGLAPNLPPEFPAFTDVWATPAVGRLYDANCDGSVDESDSPSIVFVSGNAKTTCCSCSGDAVSTCKTGVLRAVDGKTGTTLWSLRQASTTSVGFAGLSVAIGDVNGDGRMDIVAMTGEGHVALVDGDGNVLAVSDVAHNDTSSSFGWGGGLALGDMDNDGLVEIAYGRTLWTWTGTGIQHLWTGSGGDGGGNNQALSYFVDLDANGTLELLAGNTAYKKDGSTLWNFASGTGALPNAFPATADLDGDGKPEVVIVKNGAVRILEGATGAVELGPVTLPGTGSGGPPTIADFDGDGQPEIGIAQQNKYSMLKPNYAASSIAVVWEAPNHDLSSSVTGSSVFDFEGDGKAEVVYNDECFLWVYDGQTGAVRLAGLTTSFTATEASLVADVDGDGHSEIVLVSNGADPSAAGWDCDVAPWNQPDPANNRPAWVPPAGAPAYRGITVFGDKENSWVGTRTLWNQHAYHVSNVCDSRDSACNPPNVYGSIPTTSKANWSVSWLNNFRQNVQDQGLFNAPDVVVSISVGCGNPVVIQVTVRNIGLAGLPPGVEVGVYVKQGGSDVLLGSVFTTKTLLAGQSEVLDFTVPGGAAGSSDTFVAKIIIDPNNKTFNECREDNNESPPVTGSCGPT
jgi:hypothetical protein